jgi:DMSO/TMAO reductase YedYZ molybdopterin-dependent catalytic subunit
VTDESQGKPVGRRVVLGLVALGGLGVALGSRVNSALTTLNANDPTGLTGLIPGGGRFRFYSVAGSVPENPPASYELEVDGLVRQSRRFSYADLQAMPQTALTLDVQCVTGWRVPAVAWSGVLLSDLLDRVGVTDDAAAVQFGCFDGIYTESLTLEQARSKDVLVALKMQDEPVTHDHGGPVRLFVGAMYFYKSAKWLDRITVTDKVIPGYWEERGYDVDAWVGRSNGRDDAPTV